MNILRKFSLCFGLMLVINLLGCGRSSLDSDSTLGGYHPAELVVFIAASLTEAFGELGNQFEAMHPGVRIVYNIAGSQQLARQLIQGAGGDIFASANQVQMENVIASGRASPAEVEIFTENQLVVIFPTTNPANIQDLSDLSNPGLRLILAAPEVPAGTYALEYLSKASKVDGLGPEYKQRVLNNVISYEESVRFVLAKVALGEADAGIVYSSDVVGSDGEKVGRLEIPAEYNIVARYPLVILIDSPQPDLARAFVDFVLSPPGQTILADYGFSPVGKE